MWAVHVRYEKERDGHHKRQNQYQDAFGFNSSCTIADQQVGADGDCCHHTPSRKGGIRFHQAACVYPCEFNTPFMPEIARATTGVGCDAARAWTAEHSI
jgi:hypothetical protein